MPEKQITKEVVVIMLAASFLMTIAKALTEEPTFKRPLTEWIIRLITGMAAGVFFGSVSCWFLDGNEFAIFAITGAGTIIGMEGVKRVSEKLSEYISKKIK